jgi:hypothetical protein
LLVRRSRFWREELVAGAKNQLLELRIRCLSRLADAGAENQLLVCRNVKTVKEQTFHKRSTNVPTSNRK